MQYLDYAVYYGGVIVPLLLLPPLGLIDVLEDEGAGRCKIVNKPRRARR